MLGIENRVLCSLVKYSTTELCPQPWLGFFWWGWVFMYVCLCLFCF